MPETLPEPFHAIAMRRVGADRLVAFEGRQYSVPFPFVGQEVEVRGAATSVQVFTACELVAVHPRGPAARLLIDRPTMTAPAPIA